ncbi:MAG TPA: hypothetical protein VEW72_00285 [Burkholderiales bacterium]|nr:hypothetical protein [Burkholderiales bacterium]
MTPSKWIWILWPSFLAAGAATAVFFTLFDPAELVVFGETVDLGRTAVYSIGFFAFWAVAGSSSFLTCFFQRTATQINSCPLEPAQRPSGCPKREDGGCA